MKNLLCVLALSAFFSISAQAGDIPSYNTGKLTERFSGNDTVYIINFWATWCIPCVKELPEFDRLETYYSGKPVKILLVSFDFKESYPDKLDAFVKKRKLLPEVVWFNETNANEFIPKIENKWSGAVPATLIIDNRKKTRHFIEDTITFERIKELTGDI